MKCYKCNKEIRVLQFFLFNRMCDECIKKEKENLEKEHKKALENEEEEKKKKELKNKALSEYKIYIKNKSHEYIWENANKYNRYSSKAVDFSYPIYFKKDRLKKYPLNKEEIIEKIIKSNFENISKVFERVEYDIAYKLEQDKIKEREQSFKIKEKVEKDYYGQIKTRREIISKDKQELIFKKFGNKCVICGRGEGLHIHHKDKNPKNSSLDNLILLCGVCHKKIHMKVR